MNPSVSQKGQSPILSIIMPVYNVAPYLEEAVLAVINQSFQDFELLLVDDGATDGSAQLCDALSQQDERIKVFHKANGGQASARNFGLDQAQGALIGFIDGDDWIEPDFYACLVQQLIETGADLSACRFVKVSDRSQLQFATSWQQSQVMGPEEALKLMFDKTGMRYSPCDKLYKRKLFKELRYPVGCHYEDKAMTYQLIHLCQRVVYSPSEKYHYYMRPDSVMRRPLSDSNFDLFYINETLIAFLESHYPNLVATAWTSYGEECATLMQRMMDEGFDRPEAYEKCQTVIRVAQNRVK